MFLNTFLRNADTVDLANQFMLVNVVAPVVTSEEDLFRQTIFYPFMLYSKFGRGESLDCLVECDTYDTALYQEVKLLDVSASYQPETGELNVFVVNRHESEALKAEIRLLKRQSPEEKRSRCITMISKPKTAFFRKITWRFWKRIFLPRGEDCLRVSSPFPSVAPDESREVVNGKEKDSYRYRYWRRCRRFVRYRLFAEKARCNGHRHYHLPGSPRTRTCYVKRVLELCGASDIPVGAGEDGTLDSKELYDSASPQRR